MLSIRLPGDLEARLTALADATGRTKSFYARKAIMEQIEDMEDTYLAEKTLENIRSGKDKIITGQDVWNDLDD